MSDLKPCPFCGGKAAEVYSTNPAGFWFVKCEHVECGVRGPMNKDQQAAIDGWNLRAPDPAVAELLSALERATKYLATASYATSATDQRADCERYCRDAIAKAKEGAK